MPFYGFINKETGEETEELMSWQAREKYLEEHPELEAVVSAANFGDSIRMGMVKPDNEWRDALRKIKEASGRNNTINTFD